MKTLYNIKWTNRLSGESGFVKRVLLKKGYFENTYDQPKAKNFDSKELAEEQIKLIKNLPNENKDNVFEVIEVEWH